MHFNRRLLPLRGHQTALIVCRRLLEDKSFRQTEHGGLQLVFARRMNGVVQHLFACEHCNGTTSGWYGGCYVLQTGWFCLSVWTGSVSGSNCYALEWEWRVLWSIVSSLVVERHLQSNGQ